MDRTSWQTIKCGIKLTILLSILLWSGILVVGLHRQYQLLAKAKDQVEKDLVGFGFSSSKMAEKQSGCTFIVGKTLTIVYKIALTSLIMRVKILLHLPNSDFLNSPNLN